MRLSLLGLFLFSTAAFAARPDVPTGFYLGAGIGRATVNLESPDFRNDYEGSATSTRAIAGYRFLPWVAAEASYDDFGRAEDDVGDRYTRVRLQTKFHAVSVGPVGLWPLGPMDLKVKLGLTSWDGRIRNLQSGYSEHIDNTDVNLGFGVQYRFKRFAIRSDWDVYALGFDDDYNDKKDYDDSIGNWSLGVTWTF